MAEEADAPVVKDKATAEGDETQEPMAATGGDAEAAQPEGTKDIQPAAAEPPEPPKPSQDPQPAEAGHFSSQEFGILCVWWYH